MQIVLPEWWGNTKVTFHFEATRKNAVDTALDQKEAFQRLERIDSLFRDAIDAIGSPSVAIMIPALLFYRTHSAFLAAFQIVIGGQATEGFPIIRFFLEASLYALHAHVKPENAKIWTDRNETDPTNKNTAINAFTTKKLRKTLESKDSLLSNDVFQLYDQLIDFGGHPNLYSISPNVRRSRASNGNLILTTMYTNAGEPIQATALMYLARAGCLSLCIHRLIWKEQFGKAELSDRIESEKSGF